MSDELDTHQNSIALIQKVLVIDDHILFRDGLISLFNSAPDFEIVGGAGSVHEGIAKARRLSPDIVLMDFHLPDGTGLDATKAILAELPDCKIIFLTVQDSDESLFSAIRAGAKGYVLKNVASTDLITNLRSLVRGEIAMSRKMATRIVEEFSRLDAQKTENNDILAKLSPRELDILCELASGASNNDIAQRLYLSTNTVKHHVRNTLKKIGVDNRREAGLLARQLGLKSKYSSG
ncbi:MAG: response regulator transcription factor [Chloroflexota bacterium]